MQAQGMLRVLSSMPAVVLPTNPAVPISPFWNNTLNVTHRDFSSEKEGKRSARSASVACSPRQGDRTEPSEGATRVGCTCLTRSRELFQGRDGCGGGQEMQRLGATSEGSTARGNKRVSNMSESLNSIGVYTQPTRNTRGKNGGGTRATGH